MSETTTALIAGLDEMLKNRGSMTVNEVKLLRAVKARLEEHEKLKGGEKARNGVRITEMLLRFLTNPIVSEKISEFTSYLIDQLH